jgi:hypothetical protein
LAGDVGLLSGDQAIAGVTCGRPASSIAQSLPRRRDTLQTETTWDVRVRLIGLAGRVFRFFDAACDSSHSVGLTFAVP